MEPVDRALGDCNAAFLQLQCDGYVVLREVLNADTCVLLAALFPSAPERAGGLRNVLHGEVAQHPAIRRLDELAGSLLRSPVQAVRAILFDKTPASNWAVAWHQDLSIPVRERHAVEGFRGWSRKEGVWHVQPPPFVLENMLTLRLHLDDCAADNAPLQLLPRSHLHGRIPEERIGGLLAQGQAVSCIARAGDLLVMRPALLHASNKAIAPSRRRVLHLEYASRALPAPLHWHDARHVPADAQEAALTISRW